jgi:long-chain fatty acid transport protein
MIMKTLCYWSVRIPVHKAAACRCIVLLCGAVLVFPFSAKSVGLRLPNQDPEAIARGNAFVATADNPSAIYYNPAGITQLEGNNLRAGMYFVSAGIDYTGPAGTAKANGAFQPVPELYYVYSPKGQFAFGLGVYAPYGLSVDWGDKPPFGAIAQKGKLLYVTVNPVIAWRLHPTLSLAFGPTLNYSEAKFDNFSFKFRGDDVGFGFKAGLLWKPCRQWAFGVSYHSATDLDYSGHSEVPAFGLGRSFTQAEAHFPQFVVAGVSFRPTTNWNFEFDVDWTDWDSLHQVVFQRADTVAVPFLFNYVSSFMYEFGVTRQLGRGYFASLGYFFSENSSPDKNFNPLVPDSDLHLGSIGFGHRGERWDWAVAYHFGYQPNRTVSGSLPGLADGKYEILNHGINLAATLKF